MIAHDNEVENFMREYEAGRNAAKIRVGRSLDHMAACYHKRLAAGLPMVRRGLPPSELCPFCGESGEM